MDDDKLERREVDFLIRELSAPPRPGTAKTVASQPVAAPSAGAAGDPGDPGIHVVNATIGTPAKKTQFVSAINLPPLPGAELLPKPPRESAIARLRGSLRLPELPSLPQFRRLPRLPSLSKMSWRSRMPRLSVPWTLPALPGLDWKPRQVTRVRMCVGLGVLLATAMPYWPYPKACAWWLLFYLFAVGMVVVAGIWGARLTWATRLGIAHTVALAIILWGITLAAEETLPRIGYAKAEAVWWCPE